MSMSLRLRTETPVVTMFSAFRAPVDSTLIQNLFGFPSALYGASCSSSSSCENSLFGHSEAFG